jgi:hypothetical protein
MFVRPGLYISKDILCTVFEAMTFFLPPEMPDYQFVN